MSTLVLVASASISSARSIFEGETLDAVANALAWLVLVIVPIVGIGVFWLVHILPEKIAERRHHPQTEAIQTLCLLSLFFGGLLWPLAWLWAYSKPVMYKMAYGTDKVVHGQEDHDEVVVAATGNVPDELRRLRERLSALSQKSPGDPDLQEAVREVNTLEAQLGSQTVTGGAA